MCRSIESLCVALVVEVILFCWSGSKRVLLSLRCRRDLNLSVGGHSRDTDNQSDFDLEVRRDEKCSYEM